MKPVEAAGLISLFFGGIVGLRYWASDGSLAAVFYGGYTLILTFGLFFIIISFIRDLGRNSDKRRAAEEAKKKSE
jgi:hypothetical protein